MALNRKKSNRRNVVVNDVDTVVVNSVLEVTKKSGKSVWVGTMTELNSALVSVLGRKNSNVLPRSPAALRVVLNRVVNRLRNRSIGVRFIRSSDHSRTRYVRFTR